MFELEWPWILVVLPLPLLLFWFSKVRQQAEAVSLKVPQLDAFSVLAVQGDNRRGSRWLKIFYAIIWCLLVLASSRPQWVGDELELPVSGRDLMMAVDISGSMQIEDFALNGRALDRLTATKLVAGDFIEQRKGDRLGLILFARHAYLQVPLTFDLKTVHTLLMEAAIGLAGKETAIGDAIGLAIKRLKDKQTGSRVLILMTDGANTAGEIDPLRAAQEAAKYGLKIYTIGIGADEMIRNTLFGQQRINPSQDLDESTLRAIADATGGRYFRARDTAEFEQIYRILDQLEPVAVDSKMYRPRQSLFYWPLGLALGLSLLLAMVLWFEFRVGWRGKSRSQLA